MLGAAVFGGLFLAYNEFYVGVGISPEDVGVSYLYVLSQSIALGALLLIGVVYGAVPVLANPKGEAEPDGRKSAWNGVLLGVAFALSRLGMLAGASWLVDRSTWSTAEDVIVVAGYAFSRANTAALPG
jgi:sulfite exporter TauE/SafE